MSNVFHEYDQQYSELSINLSKKCSLAFSLKGGKLISRISSSSFFFFNNQNVLPITIVYNLFKLGEQRKLIKLESPLLHGYLN